ncbi:MAG: serine/threonine protein kinase [Bradymonadia bacterium]
MDTTPEISAWGAQQSGRSWRCPKCGVGVVDPTPGDACPEDNGVYLPVDEMLKWSGDRCLGRIIGGQYSVWGIISSSHRSRIYEAIDLATGRPVAFKVFFGQHQRPVWLNEINCLSRAAGPRVVELVDYGELDMHGVQGLYIATARINGITLSNLIERRGAMSARDAMALLDQLLEALESLYEAQVVHSDLTSDAVVISTSDSALSLTLTGFGAAQWIDAGVPRAAKGIQVRHSISSGAYMAPEVFIREPVSHATDIYSAAVITVEMLAGAPLFAQQCVSDDFAELASAHLCIAPERALDDWTQSGVLIDEPTQAVLLKALRKTPEQRFRTAAEMRGALWEATLGLSLDAMLAPDGSTLVTEPDTEPDPPQSKPVVVGELDPVARWSPLSTPDNLRRPALGTMPTPVVTIPELKPSRVATPRMSAPPTPASVHTPTGMHTAVEQAGVDEWRPMWWGWRALLALTWAAALVVAGALAFKYLAQAEPAPVVIDSLQVDPEHEAEAIYQARLAADRAEAMAIEATRDALEHCRCAEAGVHLQNVRSGMRHQLNQVWRQCVTPRAGEPCKGLKP